MEKRPGLKPSHRPAKPTLPARPHDRPASSGPRSEHHPSPRRDTEPGTKPSAAAAAASTSTSGRRSSTDSDSRREGRDRPARTSSVNPRSESGSGSRHNHRSDHRSDHRHGSRSEKGSRPSDTSPVAPGSPQTENVADATNSTEAPKPLRFCFEGDYCAPTSSGRCLRELLLAARGLEMPLSVHLLRRYGSSDEYPLPEFFETLSERPPSGKARVFCLPAFALPERSEFGGLYLAVSGFDHRHPTPRELELLHAPRIVWVPSTAHRACLLSRGFSESVVRVLEPTVNPKIFHPRASWPKDLEKPEGFRFLFVGNPLRRKGLDLLLMAYLQEFKPRENVTLIIKLSHLPKLKKQFPYEIADLAKRLGAINSMFPRVRVESEFLPDEDLAGLMAGCQALVSTNRAYHTALPVREAMACGLPVIGPQALEDILGHTEKTGFVIPATKATIAAEALYPEAPETDVEEISIGHLRAAMRRAFQDPTGLAALGKAAQQQARTWGEWKTKAEHIRAAADSVPPRPRRTSS